MTKLATIAHALGGEINGSHSVLAPGPGHSARDRSLSIRLDPNAPDGLLVYSHAGDDWRECRDYVRNRLGLPAWRPGDEQNRRIPQRRIDRFDQAALDAQANQGLCAWSDDELLRIAAARRIWDEAGGPAGTLGERYLRETRKLALPSDLAGVVLRFHLSCPWRNENTGTTDRVPALIVPFRSIDDDSIIGIHRIAINRDGAKLGRRMLGVIHRAAIKLDPIGDTLAIGEGVETCMAARELGYRPAWALGSVGAISFFPVIEAVQVLVILGERGDASERAIKICGKRWLRTGRRVRVVRPKIGDDMNDVLIAERS